MIAGGNLIDFPETRLVGSRIRMSLVNDRTSELWRGFRPVAASIVGRMGGEMYSVKVYDKSYSFTMFEPSAEFDKWAAVAVGDGANVPDGLELLTIPAGEYAEFHYGGQASSVSKVMADLLGRELPKTRFELDQRPHFEILPEDYDPFSPFATERVYIPVRPRAEL